jgi:hypothetical protein
MSKGRKTQRVHRKKRAGNKSGPSHLTVRHPVGGLFPDILSTKLRYVKYDVSSGSYQALIQFRGNGMYDPEYAVGGGQPMGYDQITALYNKYKVKSCGIKITLVNAGTSPCYVSVYPVAMTTSGTAPPSGGLEVDSEMRYSKRAVLTSASAKGTVVLRNYMTTKKICGEHYLDDVFEAQSNNLPTTQWFWNIAILTTSGASDMNVAFNVELDYDADFSDPVRLAAS